MGKEAQLTVRNRSGGTITIFNKNRKKRTIKENNEKENNIDEDNILIKQNVGDNNGLFDILKKKLGIMKGEE